jgi:hypothetical protein
VPRFRPDILVAHGFSEHLWGRYAGLLAQVPHLVHVEHNTRERYTRWRLKQTRWLAARTDRIVGCSEGVRLRLLEMGMPPRTHDRDSQRHPPGAVRIRRCASGRAPHSRAS